ncbi:MAG: hypothetical protein L0229_25715 [Blastocatellia bacterium]|nr:hypothetical protein [Blastocatellia bacterium]
MLRIDPQRTREEIERFVERAKEIYRDSLAAKLEPAYTGKIVAIEPETGAYFVGEDEVRASEQARAAGQEGPFYFLRVGSLYTHRLITPRR